mmetsp:Transcript_12789/g.22638  ORF Transcript_12789/g.22638 Transcript_12789/m.22638 type:complete len:211 (+) Transcript_12789:777-1409(+)
MVIAGPRPTPPRLCGTSPKPNALNHCQCISFMMRKRCRFDMDAFDTHSGSSESQCSSFSGRLHAMTKKSWKSPRYACSASIPGCFIAPLAIRAKTLNGVVPVVSSSLLLSMKPMRSNSSLRAFGPPSSSMSILRAPRKLAASLITGNRPVISALRDVAPSVPGKKKAPFATVLGLLTTAPEALIGSSCTLLTASSFKTLITSSNGKFLKP